MMEGMAYPPENRKEEGIIVDPVCAQKISSLPLQAKKGMFRLMSRKEQEEFTDKYIDILQPRQPTGETPIKQLSGGKPAKGNSGTLAPDQS